MLPHRPVRTHTTTREGQTLAVGLGQRQLKFLRMGWHGLHLPNGLPGNLSLHAVLQGPATPPSPSRPQPSVTSPPPAWSQSVSHRFLPPRMHYLTIPKPHKVHLLQIMGRQLLHDNS